MSEDRIFIVGTGIPLLGRGIRSVQTVMEEMILGAQSEIIIATYTVSGNLEDFFRILEDAAARGVRIKIIVNRLEDQPAEVRDFLSSMSRQFPHVSVYR